MHASIAWLVAGAALVFPASARGQSSPAVPDTLSTIVANRVVLDIAAPPHLIWSFLPSIRQRPNMEVVSLNGLRDQFGSRFDTIFRDSTGKVTRHDRVEVLHWEPGNRYTALVTYLPPAEPITIVYNVDLRAQAGSTHFVMDSYATVRVASGGTEAERVARLAAQRAEFQSAVLKGYESFKKEVEAAAKVSSPPTQP